MSDCRVRAARLRLGLHGRTDIHGTERDGGEKCMSDAKQRGKRSRCGRPSHSLFCNDESVRVRDERDAPGKNTRGAFTIRISFLGLLLCSLAMAHRSMGVGGQQRGLAVCVLRDHQHRVTIRYRRELGTALGRRIPGAKRNRAPSWDGTEVFGVFTLGFVLDVFGYAVKLACICMEFLGF